jgi:hypothetical protein
MGERKLSFRMAAPWWITFGWVLNLNITYNPLKGSMDVCHVKSHTWSSSVDAGHEALRSGLKSPIQPTKWSDTFGLFKWHLSLSDGCV